MKAQPAIAPPHLLLLLRQWLLQVLLANHTWPLSYRQLLHPAAVPGLLKATPPSHLLLLLQARCCCCCCCCFKPTAAA
jgi:hypothetical protein